MYERGVTHGKCLVVHTLVLQNFHINLKWLFYFAITTEQTPEEGRTIQDYNGGGNPIVLQQTLFINPQGHQRGNYCSCLV